MMPDVFARVALTVSGSFELSVIAKATVVLTLALVAVRCARRARASVRHVVLASAFGALLLLPAVVLMLPPFPVAVSGATVRGLLPARQIEVQILSDRRSMAVIDHVRPASRQPADRAGGLLRSAWSGVVLLSLAQVVLALWRLHDLRRRGSPWLQGAPLAREIAAQAGVRRPIDLLFHAEVLTPLTCGLARPAIVLPSDAERWDDRQLRHALVHEMEHVRRADTVVQLAARIVCALYWFHPLVWIAWRRLCLESERACDDAVLRDSERTEYAEQLVALAGRLSSHAWLPGVSMANRSDLSARIEAILDSRQSRGRVGALSASAIVACAVLVIIGISPLRAVTRTRLQAPGGGPTFDVASVKPNKSGDVGMGIQASPGGLRASNVTVRLLMRTAYRIQDSQVAGGPDWLDTDRFDIVAKSEGNASVDQLSLMMRALLADRFKLVVHKESRERPIYTLVMARSDGRLGPQLQRRDCVPAPLATTPGANQQLRCGIIETGSGRVNFRGALMSQIAEGLSGFVGRVVLDRTGLSGNYDLNLQWTPELVAPSNHQPGSDVKAIDPDGQSIFTAVQEQLGFKLQPTQGPVDVLVIDRVEHPVPN